MGPIPINWIKMKMKIREVTSGGLRVARKFEREQSFTAETQGARRISRLTLGLVGPMVPIGRLIFSNLNRWAHHQPTGPSSPRL